MTDFASSIKIMTDRIASILSCCDPAIYLYGSCTMDDFRQGWSDIDILVLTRLQIPDEQAVQLVSLRQAMLEEEPDNLYYRSFEGGMLTLDAFAGHTADRVVYWGTGGQRITDTYDIGALCRTELLDNGILLHGRDIRNALSRPSFSDMKENIQQYYEGIRKYGGQTGRSLYSYGWLLDISRGIYTLRTGKIIAKTAAGEWAMREGLCPDREALEIALQVRKHPAFFKKDETALDYAEELGDSIQRYADVLEAELKGREDTNMHLPESIRQIISNETYRTDDIGMSKSSVLLFSDKVLKIQERSRESENERRMMEWLRGRLPVPQVLACETTGDRFYLLMSKIPGKMACDEVYMQHPARQVKLLAAGLKKLWGVDVSNCPADWSLKNKLAQAEYNVKGGLVDMDNVEPDTFGENGFQDPAALLQWLYENQPREELVLSHGDYCLPNVFGIGDGLSGYIDLGRTGIADRWCDIALCYRSLSHNYSGSYHGRQAYEGYDDMLLFRELGLEPDWDKIRYYILLDELF